MHSSTCQIDQPHTFKQHRLINICFIIQSHACQSQDRGSPLIKPKSSLAREKVGFARRRDAGGIEGAIAGSTRRARLSLSHTLSRSLSLSLALFCQLCTRTSYTTNETMYVIGVCTCRMHRGDGVHTWSLTTCWPQCLNTVSSQGPGQLSVAWVIDFMRHSSRDLG